MADDIAQFHQEYDELAEAVGNSTHEFYETNLANWFSFIDENSEASDALARLEEMNNFDKWYQDHVLRHQSGGDSRLTFPSDRKASLGTRITLFRRMAAGTIDPILFAHCFVSRAPRFDNTIRDLSQQLFVPMKTELKPTCQTCLRLKPKALLRSKFPCLRRIVSFRSIITARTMRRPLNN